MAQEYYQNLKFWMNVFAVFEQLGRDTIPGVSIDDEYVIQPSLQERRRDEKPWWKYFVQTGEKFLLTEPGHWVETDWDVERVPMEAIA